MKLPCRPGQCHRPPPSSDAQIHGPGRVMARGESCTTTTPNATAVIASRSGRLGPEQPASEAWAPLHGTTGAAYRGSAASTAPEARISQAFKSPQHMAERAHQHPTAPAVSFAERFLAPPGAASAQRETVAHSSVIAFHSRGCTCRAHSAATPKVAPRKVAPQPVATQRGRLHVVRLPVRVWNIQVRALYA